MTDGPGKGADILRLPVRKDAGGDSSPAEPSTSDLDLRDTSFEIALDDAPIGRPVPVDSEPSKDPVFKPVIPEHLQTWVGVKRTAVRFTGRQWHRVKVHSVRSPAYAFWAVIYAFVGAYKAAKALGQWCFLAEAAPLRKHAAQNNHHKEYLELHKTGQATASGRVKRTLFAVVCLIAALAALFFLAPWWIWIAISVCLILLLAHYGRPADRPIVNAAVVTPQFRKLNADTVLRAYYAAGLGNADKPDQQIKFGSTMSRNHNNTGSKVLVWLPYGKGFDDALKNKGAIASGLDVATSQVYLTKHKDSHRGHWLFVTDVDPLSIPAGRTPLLDGKRRDIWRPAPLGLDEHANKVAFPLVFWSMLFGAPPRKGKSYSARLLALYSALDPYVRLSVFDGKGSPDWRMFAAVAHTYGFGLLPDRKQGDPVQNLLATLRSGKREIQERNQRLSDLPTNVCPEGKLTREIARNKAYKMPVWVLVFDEIQEFLTLEDKAVALEIARLLVSIIKVGPSVGVIPITATQRPSGIGSEGNVQKLFTDFRDNHLIRFALKSPSWQFSDLVLGAGAHTEGYDAATLPVGDEYRGVGILYNAPVDNCTVRCYLADNEDAEKILLAARRHREACGTLDGMAAGEAVAIQPRDPLADTLDVFQLGENWLSWTEIASRLAEQLPEQYAQITGRAIGDTLRGMNLGIENSDGRVPKCDEVPSGVTSGVKRAVLERAIARRDREEVRP